MADRDQPTADDDSQEGISLGALAHAFAQVMGIAPRRKPRIEPGEAARPAVDAAPSEAAPADKAVPAEAAIEGDDAAPDAEPAADDDACPVTPQSILEAMLFVGDHTNQPLTAQRAAELMRGVEPSEIARLVFELNHRYAASGCPYCIVDEGGGYRMTLSKPFGNLRDRFYGRIREARLSQAAVDVLAIVAYQQPLTADQISTVRGKPSSHVLAQLVHRGLLRIERLPDQRRVVRYFTTDRFLRLFGLQSLADLPQSEELDRQ